MTILGYLVPRIAASGVEPAATQALAYLLGSSPDIAKEFISTLCQTGISFFTPKRRIAAEEQYGGCRPDLTIKDLKGEVRIFVENKFWAGLMEGQPVAYLEEMPPKSSSLLVFIVPQQRMPILWDELKRRCTRNNVDLGQESLEGAIYRASAGPRTLAITSWKHVLETLEQAADASGHTDICADIVQLRGLTDQMEADKFLPLREGEVTDLNVARRMINYIELIEEIVDRLKMNLVVEKGGPGVGYKHAGRYMKLHENLELCLGVNQLAWRDWGITPLWIESEFSDVECRIGQVEKLFPNVHERDGWLYIPIPLTTGVERDRVIDDAVQEVRRIAEKLLEEFPDRLR